MLLKILPVQVKMRRFNSMNYLELSRNVSSKVIKRGEQSGLYQHICLENLSHSHNDNYFSN